MAASTRSSPCRCCLLAPATAVCACTAARAGAWWCVQQSAAAPAGALAAKRLTGSAFATQGTELEIYPRVDRHLCRVYDDDDEVSALEAPVRAASRSSVFYLLYVLAVAETCSPWGACLCTEWVTGKAVLAPVAFALLSRPARALQYLLGCSRAQRRRTVTPVALADSP